MIHWLWLFAAIWIAALIGFVFGAFMAASCAAGRDEQHYRLGFMEGKREGMNEGR